MPEFTTLDNEVTLDVSSDEDLAELKFKEQLNLNAISGIGLGEKEEAKA